MNSSFMGGFFVVVIFAVTLPGGTRCQRAERRADDSEEWTRQSHLQLSSACANKCRWPTHSGSTLFRLFRGRRAPAAPRFGLDVMLPWMQSSMNDQLLPPPPSPMHRVVPVHPTSVAAAMSAIRRGPGKPVPSRLKGFRFPAPPKPVTVAVYGQDGSRYSVGVALRPQTSPYEILNQASARYRDQNGKGTPNPFQVGVQSRKEDENCIEISSVGPWLNAADGTWDITLTDSKGKVLMSDTCLLTADRAPVPIYPGYGITLRYKPNSASESVAGNTDSK